MTELAGQVVVVTGASSGIGEATVRWLAARGAHVVFGARRADRLEALAADIEAQGGSALARPTDVTRREDLEALVHLAVERHGRLDAMVNNAGIMPLSPLDAEGQTVTGRSGSTRTERACQAAPQRSGHG